MPRTKNQSARSSSGNESPFFKPQAEGDSIEGKFSHFTETTTPDGKTGHGLVLDSGKIIPFSHQIQSAFTPVLKSKGLKPGKSTVKVIFMGQKKTKKRRKVNTYEIFLDGKQLETGSDFKKLSSEEMLSALEK